MRLPQCHAGESTRPRLFQPCVPSVNLFTVGAASLHWAFRFGITGGKVVNTGLIRDQAIRRIQPQKLQDFVNFLLVALDQILFGDGDFLRLFHAK